MSKFSRLIIYPKDVSAITGKNYRTSWLLLHKIKTHYGKEAHQSVTVLEFCEYMGLKLEDVLNAVSWQPNIRICTYLKLKLIVQSLLLFFKGFGFFKTEFCRFEPICDVMRSTIKVSNLNIKYQLENIMKFF